MSNWRISATPFRGFVTIIKTKIQLTADRRPALTALTPLWRIPDIPEHSGDLHVPLTCVRTFRDQVTDAQVGMGRQHLFHLGGYRIFSCIRCQTFLTNRDELMSTRFTGSTGRAFLFNKVVNINYRYCVLLHSSFICDSLQDDAFLDKSSPWPLD